MEDCWFDRCLPQYQSGKSQKVNAKEAECSQRTVSKQVNRKLTGRKKWHRKRFFHSNRTDKQSLFNLFYSEIHKMWAVVRVRVSRASTHSLIQDMSYNFCIPCIKPVLNDMSYHLVWALKTENVPNVFISRANHLVFIDCFGTPL